MTHLGREARTLSSNPLPHPSLPPHPTQCTKWPSWERQPYLWYLGQAGLPGTVPRPGAHSQALCVVSICVHDWEVRKGLGPRVAEEEGLKEKRQRKKSWRGQKTEEPQTGKGLGGDKEY